MDNLVNIHIFRPFLTCKANLWEIASLLIIIKPKTPETIRNLFAIIVERP
jgi:hypothetical protein